MLYECIECNHKISISAWRCPNCGAEDAGSRAFEQDLIFNRSYREQEETDADFILRIVIYIFGIFVLDLIHIF
jgi:hypothetical protein